MLQGHTMAIVPCGNPTPKKLPTGGGEWPTFRTARAQRTVRPHSSCCRVEIQSGDCCKALPIHSFSVHFLCGYPSVFVCFGFWVCPFASVLIFGCACLHLFFLSRGICAKIIAGDVWDCQ